MAVIGKSVRAETARCVTDCVIAVAGRENLNALVRNNTEFTINLLETLANRAQMSEKVLFENIRNLEKKGIDQVQLARSALLLILLGTGSGTAGETVDVSVNMNPIAGAVGDVNDDTVLEILTRFMKKGTTASPELELSPSAESFAIRILERFRMKLKIRKR